MIQIPAAIKHHSLDALFLGALGHQLANGDGSGDIPAVRSALFTRRRGSQSMALRVIDDLSVNVLGAAIHSQTRPGLATAYTAANALVNPQPDLILCLDCHGLNSPANHLLTTSAGLTNLL